MLCFRGKQVQILCGTAAVMWEHSVGYTDKDLFISCASGNEEECLSGEINMKKLLSMLLVLIMVFSLVACGANKTSFTVIATDLDGKETTFEIKTDAATVGEALVEEGLIKGHDTEYGLYVDEVNGIALDWDKDGKYWAFYINGEYAQTGVDATNVEDGAVYTFKPE